MMMTIMIMIRCFFLLFDAMEHRALAQTESWQVHSKENLPWVESPPRDKPRDDSHVVDVVVVDDAVVVVCANSTASSF
jgi:hypothetical protein